MAIVDLDFGLKPFLTKCRVAPRDFEVFGRGMECTEDVRQGEELLRIPKASCWTRAAALACPALSVLDSELLQELSDSTLITFHMLVVRNQGAAADPCRREHLAMLEEVELETICDWDKESLKLLSGTKWPMVATAMLKDIEAEFEELQEILPEFFAEHKIDAAGFMWVHRLLYSRMFTFAMPDGSLISCLIPGGDVFNHSGDAPVGSEDVNLEGEDVVVRAYKDFAVGEQAWISYAGASNGRMLFLWGFTLPKNPLNSIELTFTFPVTPSNLELYQSLASGLDASPKTAGALVADPTQAQTLQPLPPDAEVPSEVALNVSISSSELTTRIEHILAFFRLARLCKGGVTPSAEVIAAQDEDKAVRKAVLLQLKTSLASMMYHHGTTLEQDLAALPAAERDAESGEKQAIRRLHALRVLISEKEIYAKCLTYLDVCAHA